MAAQHDLLSRVKRFLLQHEMAPSVFGRAALNDPSFVFELERGRSPSLKTAARVESFMRARERMSARGKGRR